MLRNPKKTKTEPSTLLITYQIFVWFGVLIIDSFKKKWAFYILSSSFTPSPCPPLPSAAHCACGGLSPFLPLKVTVLLTCPALLSPCAGSGTDPSTARCAVRKWASIRAGWAFCWLVSWISLWTALVSTRASHGSGKAGKGYLGFGKDEVSCHVMELNDKFQPSPPHLLGLHSCDL